MLSYMPYRARRMLWKLNGIYLFPSPPHPLITFIMSLVSGVSKGEGESPPRPRQRRQPALGEAEVDEEEEDQR